MKKVHIISGLPRSGSTLLSSILKQNPRFSASMRSPLLDVILRVVRGASGEVAPLLPQEKTSEMVRGMFDTYYKSKEVAFDTERGWMLHDSMLDQLYPDHKMIICVRSIPEILNSFEKLHKKNPFQLTKMYPEEVGGDVFTRCAVLMSNGGAVFQPFRALKQYLASAKNKPLIIEYDALVSNPKGTIKSIYDFIGEEYYDHDFDNVEVTYDEYDMNMGTPGLHTVRQKIEKVEQRNLLPQEIVAQFPTPEFTFWREQK